MKKTILIILSLILIMAVTVNAGWLEGLFGQTSVTGAQIVHIGKAQPQTFSFNGIVGSSETVFLKYGETINLTNNVTAKSIYNPASKTATVTFSKTITITNNGKIKFDDGTWTVTVTSGLTGIGGVTFSRGTTSITGTNNEVISITGSATANRQHSLKTTMNTGRNAPVSLQSGKKTILPNGFTATANRDAAGVATVTFYKTVTIINNDKFSIADPIWIATVTANGVKLSGVATRQEIIAGSVGCVNDSDCPRDEISEGKFLSSSCLSSKCYINFSTGMSNCSNADGKNANLSARVQLWVGEEVKRNLSEACIDKNTVLEYECRNNWNVQSSLIKCGYSKTCRQGACSTLAIVAAPALTPPRKTGIVGYFFKIFNR